MKCGVRSASARSEWPVQRERVTLFLVRKYKVFIYRKWILASFSSSKQFGRLSNCPYLAVFAPIWYRINLFYYIVLDRVRLTRPPEEFGIGSSDLESLDTPQNHKGSHRSKISKKDQNLGLH